MSGVGLSKRSEVVLRACWLRRRQPADSVCMVPSTAKTKTYRPTSPNLVGRLSRAGCAYVADVAARIAPAPGLSRMETHLAYHVAWAEEQGLALTDKVVFAPGRVEESVAHAKVAMRSPSPFAADVRRVARLVLPRVPASHRYVVSGRARKPPYTNEEQVALWALAAGLPDRDRASYRNALALGLGFGITGPAASAVQSEHVAVRHGLMVVRHPLTGRLAGSPSPRVWATLADGVGAVSGPLTEVYTAAGRQRLKRALARATGAPALDPNRLRATWVSSLLRADLPVDVVAAVTGLAPWTLGRYLEFAPVPDAAELAAWLTSTVQACPPDPSSFEGVLVGCDARPEPVEAQFTARRFMPSDQAAAAVWAGGLGEEVATLVDGVPGARNLVTACSSLLAWACRHPGIPLTLQALLKGSTIDRFTAAATTATCATVRSRLRRLAALAAGETPEGNATSPGAVPAEHYSDDELAQFERGRERLSEADRRLLDTYRVLGVGAGLHREEVGVVRGPHLAVRDDHCFVRVGTAGREVPIAHEYASLAASLAHQAGEGHLAGPPGRDLWQPRRRIAEACGVDPSVTRFRATWARRYLVAGVPLRVIAAAAGQLSDVAQQAATLPAPSPAENLAWLALKVKSS